VSGLRRGAERGRLVGGRTAGALDLGRRRTLNLQVRVTEGTAELRRGCRWGSAQVNPELCLCLLPGRKALKGLEQRVAGFGPSPGDRTQGVDGALIGGEPTTECLIDRDGEGGRVVSCSRPGRTAEVRSGQPPGATSACTSPRLRSVCPTTTGPSRRRDGRPVRRGPARDTARGRRMRVQPQLGSREGRRRVRDPGIARPW